MDIDNIYIILIKLLEYFTTDELSYSFAYTTFGSAQTGL